jgi:hypothetical protein
MKSVPIFSVRTYHRQLFIIFPSYARLFKPIVLRSLLDLHMEIPIRMHHHQQQQATRIITRPWLIRVHLFNVRSRSRLQQRPNIFLINIELYSYRRRSIIHVYHRPYSFLFHQSIMSMIGKKHSMNSDSFSLAMLLIMC